MRGKTALGMVICCALILQSCASASATADRRAIEEELIRNERNTWTYYSQKNTDALAEMTADDYLDVYVTGEIVDKTRYLAEVADVEVRSYELRDFRVVWLTPDAATVIYTARGEGTISGREIRSEVGVTSTWVRRNGRWLNVFYREHLSELNGQRLLPRLEASGEKPE